MGINLPPLTKLRIPIHLSDDELKCYAAIVENALAAFAKFEQMTQAERFDYQHVMLLWMLRLRQVNHASLSRCFNAPPFLKASTDPRLLLGRQDTLKCVLALAVFLSLIDARCCTCLEIEARCSSCFNRLI